MKASDEQPVEVKTYPITCWVCKEQTADPTGVGLPRGWGWVDDYDPAMNRGVGCYYACPNCKAYDGEWE